jgi:hypothetical protein
MNNPTSMKFEDLQFKPHPNDLGKQATIFFENGYGASVVGGRWGLYGDGESTFELAVLKGNEDNWDLTYDTPVTDDVIGWQSKAQIESLLNEIKSLPSCIG